MRKLLGTVSLLVLAACAPARDDTGANANAARGGEDGMAGDRPIVFTPDSLQWADVDPTGAPGVRIAPVYGNPSEGAFDAFLRLPAGFDSPLHTHTHRMKVVIVSGTYIQTPDGSPTFRLGPGSYFMQPGGNYRHVTQCDAASDCVFFFESNGTFDIFPAETASRQGSTVGPGPAR
jgi:hypothetical protein